ncbi:MAG TPA: HdeD family acid-resistance protein [Allosphingosinicella sp.]|nr:HdeD family acid-resistance protein [Allosphingosinicella sp.]
MATILDTKNLRRLTREGLLAHNWWAAAIRGVSAIVLGLLAIALPDLTLLGLSIIFAVYCVVGGIFAIVLAVRGTRKGQRWGWLAFNGVVSLAAAVVALFYPHLTILALVVMFAAWALISGGATIAARVKVPRGHGRWWLIAGGAIAIVCGLLMIFLPSLGVLTLIYLVGLQALFAGITLLVLAWHLRVRYVDATDSEKLGRSAVTPRSEAAAQRG